MELSAAEPQSGLRVPERVVPIPGFVSPEARAIMARPGWGEQQFPALDDLQGWRDYVATMDAHMLPMLEARATHVDVSVEDLDVAGVPVYSIKPRSVALDGAIYLDIHGGGFLGCGGACCRAQAMTVAEDLGMDVWSVDYRRPPDYPYPAPLDDCLIVYRELLKQFSPNRIIVGGSSAGANLAAALILRGRDEGLPLPAGAVMHTPALDLSSATDSWAANHGLDVVLAGDAGAMLKVYIGSHDEKNPYASPLYGDVGKGFPPSFLSAGTRDRLLSSAVVMHAKLRAADVDAELHVIEAASHGGFHGAPEEHHINREVRKFIGRILKVNAA